MTYKESISKETAEKLELAIGLYTFVVESAIAYLIPADKTLSELGFQEALAKSIDAVKDKMEEQQFNMFKANCLDVASKLDRIKVSEDNA